LHGFHGEKKQNLKGKNVEPPSAMIFHHAMRRVSPHQETRLPRPAAIFNCQRAGLVAGCLSLVAGSRKQHKTGEKKASLRIWRESARRVRKWGCDHKGFLAVSYYMAVSKNFLMKNYFWSKHHARRVLCGCFNHRLHRLKVRVGKDKEKDF
jgi:hypothetical protein